MRRLRVVTSIDPRLLPPFGEGGKFKTLAYSPEMMKALELLRRLFLPIAIRQPLQVPYLSSMFVSLGGPGSVEEKHMAMAGFDEALEKVTLVAVRIRPRR